MSDEIKYIPIEKQALEILRDYNGNNNYLLILKNRVNRGESNVGRKVSEYIVKNHNKKVIGIGKWFDVDNFCGEELQKRFLSIEKPTKLFIQKILADTDRAIHIWGKIWEDQDCVDMWVPKYSIIKPRHTNKVDIAPDHWEIYNRLPMEHQIPAIIKMLENDRFILADDMGLAKMESVDNRVFTPYGRKRIGDLKIDDKVIGSDGKDYNVTGIFPQGIKDLYRITFNDGCSILVGAEHLWTVSSNSSGENNKNRQNRYITLSTQQMLDKELTLKQKGYGWNEKRPYQFSTYYKRKNGQAKWQIPIVKPIEFADNNNNPLPIDPYLLGLALGDGHIQNIAIKFTTHKDDFDEMFGQFNICESKLNPKRPNVRCGAIYVDGLKELKLNQTRSHTKFIPEIYKYSTVENRIALLQGLMDTDGHCQKPNKKRSANIYSATEYTTVSEQLANDMTELVHSLGGIVRTSSKIGSYKKNGVRHYCKKVYKLNIKLPNEFNPFKLSRKANSYNTPKKYKVGRYIKDIRLETQGKAVCISVDSPDQLYVTEHAIVTHNTSSAIISSIETKVNKILIVCPASLKLNWKKEIQILDQESKIGIVDGSKWISGAKWTIVNYDILKNFHTVRDKRKKDQKLITTILDEKFDIIIGDEAHYLKNTSANRTKLFNDFSKNTQRLWLLTGTPITNRPMDFYNLLDLCKHRLARNWIGYAIRYCAGKQFYGKGGRKIWDTKGSSNLDELKENTKDIVLRRRKEEVLNLPDKIIQPIYLPLQYQKEYQSIVGEYQSWAEHQQTFNLSLHLAQLVKLRQFLSLSKVESTIEIAENAIEEGKKVIIFTNFTDPVHHFQEHFGKRCVIHHGPLSKAKRDEAVEEFQNNPEIQVFIGNIISAGVGLTLTAAELVIFNDLSWLPADHLQAQDRAHRIGQKNIVNVYYNIIDETLDLHLFEALMKKMKVIDQVMGDSNVDEDIFKTVISKIR